MPRLALTLLPVSVLSLPGSLLPLPPHGNAKYSLLISETEISSTHEQAIVSWSGIYEASSGDWIAACCSQVRPELLHLSRVYLT